MDRLGSRARRTVFQDRLLPVLPQESRELRLRLLHVIREVVPLAPLPVERPVRLLALPRAKVRAVASRAQREVLPSAAVGALVRERLLLLEVRGHVLSAGSLGEAIRVCAGVGCARRRCDATREGSDTATDATGEANRRDRRAGNARAARAAKSAKAPCLIDDGGSSQAEAHPPTASTTRAITTTMHAAASSHARCARVATPRAAALASSRRDARPGVGGWKNRVNSHRSSRSRRRRPRRSASLRVAASSADEIPLAMPLATVVEPETNRTLLCRFKLANGEERCLCLPLDHPIDVLRGEGVDPNEDLSDIGDDELKEILPDMASALASKGMLLQRSAFCMTVRGAVRFNETDALLMDAGDGAGETASHTTPFAWCTPFLKDFSRRHSSPALPFQRLTGKTFD
jgi:hypothetical protein